LIKKIGRHPIAETTVPPTIGPRASDTPNTAPHTPTACARSRGSLKVFVMIDIATGLSIAPPTAWSTRKATSSPTVGARLHSSEASEKTPRPVMKIRLRPSRSAVEPPNMSRLAMTTV
jgi:hypothetical protein